MKKKEAPKKWNRSLGTSKKDQGVVTPPRPRFATPGQKFAHETKDSGKYTYDFLNGIARRRRRRPMQKASRKANR